MHKIYNSKECIPINGRQRLIGCQRCFSHFRYHTSCKNWIINIFRAVTICVKMHGLLVIGIKMTLWCNFAIARKNESTLPGKSVLSPTEAGCDSTGSSPTAKICAKRTSTREPTSLNRTQLQGYVREVRLCTMRLCALNVHKNDNIVAPVHCEQKPILWVWMWVYMFEFVIWFTYLLCRTTNIILWKTHIYIYINN